MHKAAIHVLSNSTEDRELVLDFFCVFSRFEYALKRANFLTRPDGDAQVNWDTYANSIAGRFKTKASLQFERARGLLLGKPPKKQTVVDSELDWDDSTKGGGESEERYLLRLVTTVRNNLFHGGKYPFPVRADTDTGRNRELIRASLVVLRFCLSLDQVVGEYFMEAA